MLRAYGHADAKRGFQYRSGVEVPDIQGVPFRIEAKCGKPALKSVQALAQCELDGYKAGDNRPCFAVCKADRRTPTVTMRLHVLLSLAGAKTRGHGGWSGEDVCVTIDMRDWLKLVSVQL